ncbi:pyruvate dehydrogenase complex transcriptional repressor PdhR [Amphritea sp. 2_MG-2023]|jgi:GntR family transcriptional repressor for pyruvate dehydrogenase complex|uniref:pyruvate dehydrogenase complex transcriptional repressor PdhR n=1 Tax=Amphritea TaxID=515417 RepID=UPI001C0670C9|nr:MULTISPECIES: pyruvate dehydrogenase complex transcriptional repressor PdhR [Amphritea]MBU2964364.1 pyruvate dehydrogenase complex transcriptional repressor PdhR [Amphritea atlantica]MDO6419676.1 pyruvate dehydrogenase complex transcriptional repressor PdhR [Amphritea sp. 2_MG-2023]MDX2424321.1 pyruvate dehydrogenase complex transcriptional repressor PdhR [Amphritea sp.]
MVYQRVKQPKISDVIMGQLEEMVLEGSLKPGQKLPAERELAKQFEVSRPSLREAIQKLAAKGVLVSRQGGGTYVSEELGRAFSDPLLELFQTHPEAQYDLLEFRHALEGVSAYYAALRSTPADKAHIRARYDALQIFHDRKEFDKEVYADVDFHLAIAESTHNMVLLHMMRALFSLLRQHIWENLKDVYPKSEIRGKIHEQHTLLLDAIVAGEPEKARKAAHDHLAYVEEALLEQGKEKTRVKRALRRADVTTL